MNIVAILNPKSQRGRVHDAWKRVRVHLHEPVDVLETKAPGHAIALARNAIKQGARIIIAVGGDGTINEVVNGFFENDRSIAEDAKLAVIPHGTGSDFRRMIHAPEDGKKAAEVIHDAEARPLDLLKVRFRKTDGSQAARYSINVTSFGMGGAVAARANQSRKTFGGKVAFLVATLQTALRFGGSGVVITLDDSKTLNARITNVAVGNGQFHGGGMWVCPRAVVDDGLLDVTVIKYLTLPEIILSLPLLYNGRIYSHPKVEFHRVKHIYAQSENEALIEIDGEPLGKLPLDIEIVPRAIRVLMP